MAGYREQGLFPRSYYGWYGPYGARPGIERPDETIGADVITTLQDDPRLDPSAVSVTVEDGVVTLSGEVDSQAAKDAATEDAWDTPGVVGVHDNLMTREG